MAVHLPLGPEAILEAQLLMLASHNILNPSLNILSLNLQIAPFENDASPSKPILYKIED